MIKEELNLYGKNKTPVLFIIDCDIKNPQIIPLDEINNNEIKYSINGFSNIDEDSQIKTEKIFFRKKPISFQKYKKAFLEVKNEFIKGNSVLLNLTFPTEIETNLSLHEIYSRSNAKYRLFYKNQFVVFSPEEFITIKNNKITTHPMKGTIDASIPDACNKLLNDEKEFAEHITIVDLLRNDLGIISKKVEVENFRYIDEISTFDKKLLQVSSKISGKLEDDWQNRLGEIISAMLPAGSVTGAPKKKTVEIIKRVENYDRGFYTGIFGYFDGNQLESAVMIRFIENKDNKLVYKSGGGITIYSDVKKEYQELIDKVYLPFKI